MRKIIFLMHVSLDGYVNDSNGSMDWIAYTPDLEAYVHRLHDRTDTAIYGRVTYEMMKSYWPTVLTEANPDPAALNHAKWTEAATKVAVSNSLTSSDWVNTVIVGGDVATKIKEMKAQAGKDMWLLGSPSTAKYFIQHNLIDEYWLNTNPIILGGGRPLYGALPQPHRLSLLEVKPFEGGAVMLKYAAVRA